MLKYTKIFLGIILLLLSVQFIYAGLQYNLVAIIFLGGLFFVLALFVFLNKKWVKTPLFIILSIFLIYSIYWLIKSFYLTPSYALSQTLINWQIFLMIEYSILAILGIIINWKN